MCGFYHVLKILNWQLGWSTSTEVECVYGARFLKPGELNIQCFHECRDKVISSGDHGIITVATMVPAKRQVNIGGTGEINHHASLQPEMEPVIQ